MIKTLYIYGLLNYYARVINNHILEMIWYQGRHAALCYLSLPKTTHLQ
jgi:hypothetical protein